mgnify:CR=1 FL=1
MKRFEIPSLKVENFNVESILTDSVVVEPTPVPVAAGSLAAKDVEGFTQTFEITL